MVLQVSCSECCYRVYPNTCIAQVTCSVTFLFLSIVIQVLELIFEGATPKYLGSMLVFLLSVADDASLGY